MHIAHELRAESGLFLYLKINIPSLEELGTLARTAAISSNAIAMTCAQHFQTLLYNCSRTAVWICADNLTVYAWADVRLKLKGNGGYDIC